jgi:hypothetical protein
MCASRFIPGITKSLVCPVSYPAPAERRAKRYPRTAVGLAKTVLFGAVRTPAVPQATVSRMRVFIVLAGNAKAFSVYLSVVAQNDILAA